MGLGTESFILVRGDRFGWLIIGKSYQIYIAMVLLKPAYSPPTLMYWVRIYWL